MYSLTMIFLRSLYIKKRDQKGQALVEMAFSIFLLVLLVFGIIEFGRAMYTKNTLTNAARAGARAAVVQQSLTLNPSGAILDCGSTDSVQQAICTGMKSIVGDNTSTVSNITFAVSDSSGNSPPRTGDNIDVTIQLTDYRTILPKLFSLPSTLTGEASMRYE